MNCHKTKTVVDLPSKNHSIKNQLYVNFWTGLCKSNKNVCGLGYVNSCYVKELIQGRTNKTIHLFEIINILQM